MNDNQFFARGLQLHQQLLAFFASRSRCHGRKYTPGLLRIVAVYWPTEWRYYFPHARRRDNTVGLMILEVRSLEEAIEWVKRSPNGHAGESEVEIRQVFEPEDFASVFSEEGIQLEKTIRAQLADRAAKEIAPLAPTHSRWCDR